MKWTSVKTMILVLLMVMNLFVLGELMAQRMESEKIPPVVRTAALEALSGSGIVCDEGLLPEKYLTVRSFSGSFPTAAELSRMFFGRQLAFQTEDMTLIAREGGAELRVEGESFVYSRAGKAAEPDEKKLRRSLKALGLDMEQAEYLGDGEFGFYYEKRPVFGMYIRASVDGEGSPVRVEARWPSLEAAGERRTGIGIISCIPDVIERFPEGGTVVGLTAGCAQVRDADTGALTFEPAWRIVIAGGDEEVFICK